MIQTNEDKQIDNLRIFLQSHGINPLYVATIVMIVLSISYKKDLKNWKNVELSRKWFISSILTATVLCVLVCILSLFGILHFS